ncbi:MAG: D-alanyl-D-alanine carboxypeptidase [Clostridiales bacterium]|jgi:D-alanyl-D-alanine carboxypeptidase|nr:D-alanyl-D-alanine carboxypeptidase [Clostridiales bacterium]
MKKNFTVIFIFTFLISISINTNVFAYDKPSINAEAGILMDLNTGQILYEKNINEKLAPASTTKILTALITLEECKLDERVVVGPKPPFEDGSKIYLIEGEEITVKDLLYATMLESANDAALALAEYISGSSEKFAKLMNERAAEIGCNSSNFINPNGLYDVNHYTTAYDLALIGKVALENSTFREIVNTEYYEIKPTNKQIETRYIYNINKLVRGTKYNYEGADGVKTGYTTKSKNTIVASAARENQKLIAVQLRSEKDLYEDSIKLLDYGFNSYKAEKLVDSSSVHSTIKIKGTNKGISVFPKNDFYISTPVDGNPNYFSSIVFNKTFSEIYKGEELGFIEITLENGKVYKIPLIAGEDYKSFFYNLKYKSPEVYKHSLKPIFKYILVGIIPFLYIRKRVIRALRKTRKKHIINNKLNKRQLYEEQSYFYNKK